MAHDVEDLTYLLALETKHNHQFAIFDSLCKDYEYLRIRPQLLQIIVDVNTKHAMHNSIVYLTASLLDAVIAQNSVREAYKYNVHVFAVACFVLAAKFVDSSAVYFKFNAFDAAMTEIKCRASRVPLSQIISSWVDASNAAVEISKFLVLQCQVLVTNQLDWRFNRATADRFLQAHLTQCSFNESFSADLGTAQVFLDWAIFFCEMTVMSNLCCQVKPSIISMASIMAARKFLFDDSEFLFDDSDADLNQIGCVLDKEAVLSCTTDILDLFEKRNTSNVTHKLHCIKDVVKETLSLECTENLNDLFTANASFPTTPVQQSATLSTEPTPTPCPLSRLPSINFVWDSPPVCSDEKLHTVLLTPK
jgi:hypothetical protein